MYLLKQDDVVTQCFDEMDADAQFEMHLAAKEAQRQGGKVKVVFHPLDTTVKEHQGEPRSTRLAKVLHKFSK